MNINVEIGEIDLNTVVGEQVQYDEDGDRVGTEQQTLGDAVIAEAARRVMGQLSRENRYDLGTRIRDIRDSEIRAKVQPIIEAALTNGIVQTNGYGEPTGKVTTLTELIMKEANSYLTRSTDSYNRNSETVVQKIVRETVEKVIKAELAETIAEEKAKVVAAVRAKAADLIAQAVKEGIGR